MSAHNNRLAGIAMARASVAAGACGVLLLAGCSPTPGESRAQNGAEVMEMKADQMEQTAEAKSNEAAMTMMENAVPLPTNSTDPTADNSTDAP